MLNTVLKQRDHHREVPRCPLATTRETARLKSSNLRYLLKEAERALLAAGLVAQPVKLDEHLRELLSFRVVHLLRRTLRPRGALEEIPRRLELLRNQELCQLEAVGREVDPWEVRILKLEEEDLGTHEVAAQEVAVQCGGLEFGRAHREDALERVETAPLSAL